MQTALLNKLAKQPNGTHGPDFCVGRSDRYLIVRGHKDRREECWLIKFEFHHHSDRHRFAFFFSSLPVVVRQKNSDHMQCVRHTVSYHNGVLVRQYLCTDRSRFTLSSPGALVLKVTGASF